VKAMQGLTSTAAGDDEQYCKQQEFTLMIWVMPEGL